MLRILDRYIIREVLPFFFLSLLILTFILMIPPIMDVAERLIAKGVPWQTVMQIMVTLLPQGLGVTIPMSLLLGLLIGLGRLSGDRETVAAQACGVSIARMLRPVAVLAVLTWAATSYTLIVLQPDANQAFREITYRTIATRAEDEVRPRVFFEDFPNIVLYVRDTGPNGVGWSDVFLADTGQGSEPDVYVARRGRMLLDREQRRVDVMLEDGTGHHVNPEEPGKYEVHRFEKIVIGLDPESVFPSAGPQRGYRELTIPQLQAEVERLEQADLSPHRPIMEIEKKFSIPAACFVFAVIGLALGVTSRKDGKLASFALGIGVIFAYYVIMYLGEAMAKGAWVSPHLAMWLPNIVLGGAGVVLLFWRSRSVERRVAIPLPFRGRGRRHQEPGAPGSGPAVERGPVGVVRAPQLWGLRLNILDWYVVKLYLGRVGLAFVFLLGLFYISTFIDLSDKLFKGETTGRMLLQYFWFATPQFIYYVLPISALVSTLVTIGLLTKSSELTVMKACGISLYRAAGPLLLFGLVWSGVLFALEESILAGANRRAEAIRHVIRGGSPQTFDVLNRKWIVGRDGGSIYHYLYMSPERQELNGLSIYEFAQQDWRLAKRTYTTQATFQDGWQARHVWAREFDDAGVVTAYRVVDEQELSLEAPEYFVTEQPDAERMTYGQLDRYIRELRASGFEVVQLVVALHRKLSFPFVTVVLTLIAVPFAVSTGRRGALYGVGVGIVLAITYWMVISVFGAIGSAGLLAPVLAAWAPNILAGTGAAYLLLTVRT